MLEYADNHYARLGVPKDATREEIRKAYHNAARRLHPDANPAPGAVEQFLRIQDAYEILFDSRKRFAYDRTLPPIDTSPGVEIETVYSRGGLVKSSEPQLLYVLLEVKPLPSEGEVPDTPLNLSIVIDRSTSMQGARMDKVKTTARRLVRQLRPADYLSIVAFSDRAEVIVPATRGTNRNRIESRISLLQTGGGTEIYSGLQAGVGEVSRYLKPNYINHLILITDGHTYGDEKNCLRLSEEAREKGITFSGLGIGNEWNDAFLDDLTSKTGGSSIYIANTGDIKRFMELKFRGLNQIYAENTTLNFNNNPEVEIRYAFRLQPESANIPVDGPIMLGNIHHDSNLTVVLELLIKGVSGQNVYKFLDGFLKIGIPTRIIPVTKTKITLSRPIQGTASVQHPPPKIAQALSRLTLYRMQEQAKKDLEKGNVEQATRRLRYMATHLLAQGENVLATTVLSEAGRIERGKSLSEEGGKQIKYGTRALLLPPGTKVNFL